MVELGKTKDMSCNLRLEGTVNAGFVSCDEKPAVNGLPASPTSLRTASTQSPGRRIEPARIVANGIAPVATNGGAGVAHRSQAEDVVSAESRKTSGSVVPRAPSSNPTVPLQTEQTTTPVPSISAVGVQESTSADAKNPTGRDTAGATPRSAESEPGLRKEPGAQGHEPGQANSTGKTTGPGSSQPNRRSRSDRASRKDSQRQPKGASPAPSRFKSPRPPSPPSDDEMATPL